MPDSRTWASARTPAVRPSVSPPNTDIRAGKTYADGPIHAAWATLRREGPTWWHGDGSLGGPGFWVLAGHRDVRRLLTDRRLSSTRGSRLWVVEGDDRGGDLMVTLTDPPRHTAMRKALQRAMVAAGIDERSARSGEMVTDLLTGLVWGEQHDLVDSLRLFPMAVIGPGMGLARDDWPELSRLTTMLVAPDDEEFRGESIRHAHMLVLGYLADILAARRRRPADDLISYLLHADMDGTRLSDEEIMLNAYALLLGGTITTPHVASGMVLELARDPAAHARWAVDPRLLSIGIEEGIRRASPLQHVLRYALQDVEIDGVHIRAGDPVTAWLGSANHDERVFRNPHRFLPSRRPNRHLAFGAGPHFCIGAPIARAALRQLFAALLPALARVDQTGPVRYLASNFVSGIKHLPIVLHRR